MVLSLGNRTNSINNDIDKEKNDIKEDNNKQENKKINEIKRNLDEEKYVINTLKYKIEKLGGELIEEEKDMLNAEIFMTDFCSSLNLSQKRHKTVTKFVILFSKFHILYFSDGICFRH